MKNIAIFFLIALFLLGEVGAQSPQPLFSPEAGLPFIQNFSPKEYGADNQNWAIVQDQRGVMYFANGSGILAYDGVSWRIIPVPNNSTVRSLAIDKNGRIYVGAQGEIGYLAADETAQLRYISLMPHISPENRDFVDVWETRATSHGIYFRTIDHVFRWSPADSRTGDSQSHMKFKVWGEKPPYSFLYAIHDSIYVVKSSIGLFKLVSDSLVLVPGSERFATDAIILVMPFAEPEFKSGPSRMLIATFKANFYSYDGTLFTPFPLDPAAHAILKKHYFFRGNVLRNGSFAIGTMGGGAVIFGRNGELLQVLSRRGGLHDELVYGIFHDREAGLWLALNNGLARVETPSPFTDYSERTGLGSNVEEIVRYQGRIYVTTGLGVSREATPKTAEHLPRFESVNGIKAQSFALLAYEQSLLVATGRGVFNIRNDEVTNISRIYSFCLYRSKYYPNVVFVGVEDGLIVLHNVRQQWQVVGRVAGIKEQVRSIAELAPGKLWLGTRNDGYIQLKFPEPDLTSGLATAGPSQLLEAEAVRYGAEQGVPDGLVAVYEIEGRAVFASQKGLRRFDANLQRFLPDSTFGIILADTSRWISPVAEDLQGGVWTYSGVANKGQFAVAIPDNQGGYRVNTRPFGGISGEGVFVNSIYADPLWPGVMWFGMGEGVTRYDAGVPKDFAIDFPALVRRVLVKGDSLIYGGALTSDVREVTSAMTPTLKYVNNNLRFECAAPSFERASANHYQFFLQGFDQGWSSWTNETQKDYTNLPEGEYRFRVRAKNVYGHLSSEGEFIFNILPPWYRTWLAYGAYFIVFIAVFFALVQYRLKEANRRTRQLEAIVTERTAELDAKNKELQELDHLKSRFFANISHEFRTPLTLILGQIQNVKQRLANFKDVNDLQVAYNNTMRLRQLINQLLDLSKFEAGQMTLHASQQNIVPLTRKLTGTFESLAKQKQIELQFECNEEEILVYFELDKIEKIMYNLLSNALKFTPEGGKVLVSIALETMLLDDGCEQNEVKIRVRDSGLGIPKHRLPHIFDRFFQVDSSSTREHEGTGIGLALTQELVQLHGGSISVESREGFDTTFEVRLPTGKSHLHPKQIVDDHVSHETLAQLEPVVPPEVVIPLQADIQESTNEIHAEVPPDDADTATRSKTDYILVAEDNADMRAYICDHLQSDYRLIEAADGEEALNLALEHIPDLIITDIMMPKMDGYDLTRKLRENQMTSHIPIIMLTAKAAQTDRFEGLETGADVYLAKPFSTKELRIRVRKLIELRQLLQARVRKQPVIKASEVMVTSVEQKFLERLQKIVEENMGDEQFQVDDLCRQIGMSRRQLYRKLDALVNCTPAFYLKQIRLERAKQLLEKNAGNVTEVAFEVGFSNLSSFSRAFKETFNLAPSDIKPQPQKFK